jgi:exoribonuclease-2
MERYWCLRWLGQENARQVDAVVLKDEILRLVDLPLVIRLPGMPQVARGAQVKIDILRWDEVDLSIEARLLEIAETPVVAADAELDYEEADEGSPDAEADVAAVAEVGDAGEQADLAELATQAEDAGEAVSDELAEQDGPAGGAAGSAG